MAANIPLELQSQLESKNAPLEGSLDCFRVVPLVNLSQACVGSASFQQMAHPRQSLECLFQDQELKATSLLAVQSRNSALMWSLLLQWEH